MRAVEIITKKRDGGELTKDEISFFINGFTRGDIPDYQAAAWAMAVLLRGMTAEETSNLNTAMIESGDQLDLSDVVDFALDKHSTGGVGDKTTLVVLPIVAASGYSIGKMSGKGLSFTGGTLDKMESIPGYRIDLTIDEFIDQLRRIGLVLTGQTLELTPADGKLYALRDVTGTVASNPLIAASVMSKKIAAGAEGIVIDVKVGLGAFMDTVDEATQLANAMVDIGNRAERKVIALISDMNQPLGSTVGNALEVKEAIETLSDHGPDDFTEHSLVVAANMMMLAREDWAFEEAKELARETLRNGTALAKFKELVLAQGGDVGVIDDPSQLPQASMSLTIPSPTSGYIEEIHAREIGLAAMNLGAGRQKKGDPIDHAVGIEVHQNVGDEIQNGDALFTIYANDTKSQDEAVERAMGAHRFSGSKVEPLPLFYSTIKSEE
jgi:pyrimidine-nucleoside phosphorylase